MLPDAGDAAAIIETALQQRLSGPRSSPLLLGICGAQGSGKSTVSALLADRFAAHGCRIATLSLDDLYLSPDDREALAQTVHPLLRVRGVPGTHDIGLGKAVLDGLGKSGETAIPRFDKASDGRKPRSEWDRFEGPADLILFEGWCVGAAPQAEAELARPLNQLEREQDSDGRWRRHVNAALRNEYQELFGRIDMLVLLAAPSFEVVTGWRTQQEEALRAEMRRSGRDAGSLMDADQIARFVLYYERLTRHILAEMPARADLTIRLDAQRRPIG